MTTLTAIHHPAPGGDALFRSLVQNAADVITVLDGDGLTRYASPAVERVLGFRPEEVVGTDMLDGVHPDDQPALVAALAALESSATVELRVRHRDGGWRWLSVAIANLADDPAVRGFVLSARDTSGQRRLIEELERQAYTDALTGLPNRPAFMDRLADALDPVDGEGAAPVPTDVAVLFVDLDRFKVINDSLGHSVGDLLLAASSERLLRAAPAGSTVARFAGDEFTVLLTDARAVEASAVAGGIVESLRAPFRLDGREVFSSVSIGIALATAGEVDAEALLRNADVALHQAKEQGKARAVLFDSGKSAPTVERLALESDLWRAVERQELRLLYQPNVDLKTGTIIGMEALARWQHPRRGLLGPAEFIPLAEETGLILPVGRWVMHEACRQVRRWQAQHPRLRQLVMSVNVSAQEFQHPDLLFQVSDALREAGISPGTLKLEITEGALLADTDTTLQTLRSLKGLGVQLALDDFGTGYSSLNYLRRFPVDTLKIDRSFVKELGSSANSLAIVRALIALAHALDMDVTAEGFETATQLARLRDAYCDHGQGYYFSKPLPLEQMEALLASVMAQLADRRRRNAPKLRSACRSGRHQVTGAVGVPSVIQD